MANKAWFNILWAARAVTSDYDANGMDLEEASLCMTFEEVLFHPLLRGKAITYKR